MPRKTISIDKTPRENVPMARKLAAALKAKEDSGQPMIYEQELAPGRIKTDVIWDDWERVPLDERLGVILQGYELAEGKPFRDKISLAAGLTMPEATAAGMLPYQIATALRRGDPVTFEQCRNAMLVEGASQLFGPGILQLRFPTREEAEACRQRLIKRLPKSDNVWLIQIDVSVQDYLSLQDSVAVEAT